LAGLGPGGRDLGDPQAVGGIGVVDDGPHRGGHGGLLGIGRYSGPTGPGLVGPL